jgi:hypothetical protein
MKNNIILSIFIFCAFVMLYSCQPKGNGGKIDGQTMAVSDSLTDTISDSVYYAWKGAWEDNGQEYTDSVLTEYFTMPLIDLTEFNSNGQNHVAARFVLGLDTTIIPNMPHLMLVGVDSAGKSMVPPYAPNGLIYDVTRPCPELCGRASIKN